MEGEGISVLSTREGYKWLWPKGRLWLTVPSTWPQNLPLQMLFLHCDPEWSYLSLREYMSPPPLICAGLWLWQKWCDFKREVIRDNRVSTRAPWDTSSWNQSPCPKEEGRPHWEPCEGVLAKSPSWDHSQEPASTSRQVSEWVWG